MHRLRSPKTGEFEHTWFVRRDVPKDVRDRIGRRVWVQTTGRTDSRQASVVAERLWKAWGREIDEARALGDGPVMSLANVQVAIENWRRARCRAASGADYFDHLARRGVAAYMSAPGHGISADLTVEMSDPGVDASDYYYARNPDTSRLVETPVAIQMLIARLVPAMSDPDAFVQIDDFDAQMDAAVADGGGKGAMPASVRSPARMTFATALLEVVEAGEAERRRAAMGLLSRAPDTSLRDAVGLPTFQARVGDKTVGAVINQYQAERDSPDTLKQYAHVFRALTQIVGADTPIRAVTRDDVLEVRRMLAQIPKNMTKLYGRDVALEDAIERGAADDKPRLAPNTVRSYMVNLSAVMNYARLQLKVIDTNPVDGLIPKRENQTQRTGFTKDELDIVFAGLTAQREVDSAHYWVPAVLTFSGCRANEICQLRTEEIAVTEDGIHYLDLTLFANDGRRIDGKRLKNKASARAVPVHSELIKAGFLDFVARRRAAGDERLFPELTPNTFGYYSHEISRRFGKHLDRVGLPEPRLTLHGLRHLFRDSCRRAHLPTEIADGLGGWAVSVGAGYGSRAGAKDDEVQENALNMAKLTMGGFTLPVR